MKKINNLGNEKLGGCEKANKECTSVLEDMKYVNCKIVGLQKSLQGIQFVASMKISSSSKSTTWITRHTLSSKLFGHQQTLYNSLTFTAIRSTNSWPLSL